MDNSVDNRNDLKERRRELRNNPTEAEAKLWNYLRKKRLGGRKFRRQHSVGSYILDFYCPSERLCVELDGDRHYSNMGYEYDQRRTEFLSRYDIKTCRIENKRVFKNISGVLIEIAGYFKDTGIEETGIHALNNGERTTPSITTPSLTTPSPSL